MFGKAHIPVENQSTTAGPSLYGIELGSPALDVTQSVMIPASKPTVPSEGQQKELLTTIDSLKKLIFQLSRPNLFMI